MSPVTAYVVESVVTMVAVALVAVLILWGARRAGLGRVTGPLELMGRMPLDARRAIYLVRVAQSVFVVGASEAGLTKLGELPARDLGPLPPEPPSLSFKAVLAKIGSRRAVIPAEGEPVDRPPSAGSSEPGSDGS
jgi:flagellar biogenesis protein FliO